MTLNNIFDYITLSKMNRTLEQTIHYNSPLGSPDGVSEILTGYADCCPSHTDDHGHFVVELECPVVYVCLLEIEVVGEITEQVSHVVIVVVMLFVLSCISLFTCGFVLRMFRFNLNQT